MQAKDVMTRDVVSVCPETSVAHVARAMLERGISGVPVLDAADRLVGMVSEGDLMGRAELGVTGRSPWWLSILAGPRDRALDYVRSHGGKAQDVMAREVVTVEEGAPLSEVAGLLERHRIKRVPVMRDGRMVGIVSRADLLRALAGGDAERPAPPVPSDDTIRRTILARLRDDADVPSAFFDILVTEGTVHLWGAVRSEPERRAVQVAAENTPGVRAVVDHLHVVRLQAMAGD